MVSASRHLKSPVVSLLSASPASSKAAQELLDNLFAMEPFILNDQDLAGDELDNALTFPMFHRRFDSVASKCPASGAVLHFLALTKGTTAETESKNENQQAATGDQHFSLLGVTSLNDFEQNDHLSIQKSRRLLASCIRSPLRVVMNHAAGRPISASTITQFDSGLPLLNLPETNDTYSTQSTQALQGGLKELVVPFYDDSLYPDAQSLLSKLGSSTLNRPAVGLYQWPNNGIVIRPLPSAKEDRSLPSPSLVFYCKDLEIAADKLASVGGISAKIGYNGLQGSGQLMVSHPTLLGLDIRLTDSVEYTSAFPEAQEALLASSLDELQNVNVLKGDIGTESEKDARDNKMDCWVEFRANMRRPSGFMKRAAKRNGGKVKTAKVPDLPYE
jgi:hypothetical protein